MATPEDISKGLESVSEGLKNLDVSPTPETPGTNPEFMKTLQDSLLKNSDIITSEANPLQTELTSLASTYKSAQYAAEKGISASAERQRTEAVVAGEQRLSSVEESRRGYATNTALIKQIEDANTKDLRDIDLREQEALASGRMDVADKLAQLRIKSIEFTQNAKQQAFSNMLSLGQFGLQIKGAGIQEGQFKLQQQEAARAAKKPIYDLMGKAPDAGILETDTMEQAVEKYKRSKSYLLDIAKGEAQIAQAKAETAKALAGGGGNGDFQQTNVYNKETKQWEVWSFNKNTGQPTKMFDLPKGSIPGSPSDVDPTGIQAMLEGLGEGETAPTEEEVGNAVDNSISSFDWGSMFDSSSTDGNLFQEGWAGFQEKLQPRITQKERPLTKAEQDNLRLQGKYQYGESPFK